MESIFSFKNFLNFIGCSDYDFREKNIYFNTEQKINYLFNTSIEKIDESDLILLIGCNPRHEATILNARIRKAFVNNKTKIFSIGDSGNLTYDYEIIGKSTEDLKNILEKKNKISEKILASKKPLFIIGESSLTLRSGKYIFEEVKHFLYENGFINEEWNALNFIPRNASTIGCLDLNFFKEKNSEHSEFLEKIKNNNFKTLYLLNSDNLDIKKKNEFIIYQGSHGDRSAEIADVIMPNPAYTEKSGLYINLEGRVQKCNKASIQSEFH